MHSSGRLSYRQLSAFFIPLGISASLTSITHVIINGTLSRGEHAAFIIACYAIAMSLFSILERPMIVFRQTSSALVTDKSTFKLVGRFFIYVLVVTMIISTVIAFSPLGHWFYINIFGATANMVEAISLAFKVVILVIIFSGIRGLYQGIIITQLATNWLTIGVVARLIAMFITAYLMVNFNFITSVSGAIIFLVGMLIECLVSVYKGDSLLRNGLHPVDSPPLVKTDVSRFYFPLMYYFLLQTILTPVIYILLAKSTNIEMSIASFALAFSITNLILGFFMYTHQLVLQFYADDKKKVVKFVIFASIIPTLLLCLLCYTPLGMAFMQRVMGADEPLSLATITVLKFFIIKTLVFPWVDFLNGFLMLRRQTNKMLFAQLANLIVVVVTMLLLIQLSPQLNGVNGAIAASLGELAGLVIVSIIIYRTTDRYKNKNLFNKGSLR
ncbi:multi antimicrobial extrusion protein MatE [Sporosarcina sp. FSL K6-3457]|uniref:multi antimicrobial extrusion protein MatE n=1 Tax=Sporosarcina sp. FSL K6-3457 TaxID=2978204 RepID=UPI0030F7F142